MANFTHLRLVLMASAASLICMSRPTAAAEGGPDGAASSEPVEIVVVGQQEHYRGDVPIKELPQAVQTISSEQLEQLNITRLDDALDLVSGAAHQNNFGGLWNSFAIRGFAGDENVPSGFLVNGFNAGRGFSGPRDVANVERIEVLKGPSSALFGRGEPGGTINIITKKPSFDFGGSLSGSAGSYDSYRGDLDVTGPVSQQVAVRFDGAYEDDGSFRDYVTTKKYVLAPSVLAKIDDSTSLTYELYNVRQQVPFDRGIAAFKGNLGTMPITRFLGEPGDGPVTTSGLSHQLELEHKFSRDWTLLIGVGGLQTWLEGFGQDPELAASRDPFFNNGTILSRRRIYRDFNSWDFVPRAELSGRFDLAGFTNHLLAGADFEDFNLNQENMRYRPPAYKSTTTLAQANAIDVFDPVYGNLAPVGPFTDKLEIDKSWGTYLHDQIDITDEWKFRAGVRYDNFHQSLTDLLAFTIAHQSQTAVSPSVGLVYEPLPDLSLYASYAQGFRPNTGFDAHGNAFQPETTKSYEVGAKVEAVDNSLSGTVSLFRMNKTNVLTTDPLNPGFSTTAGEAESQGVELDVSGKLPWNMHFFLGYAYTDAFFTNSVLDPDFGRPLPPGAPLIDVPKNSGNLLITKDFMIDEQDLNIGMGVDYVGRRLGETGTSFYLPSYTLLKFNASYQLTDNVRLLLTVNNATNKVYYPQSYSTLWVAPGAPREATFRVTYSF